MAPVNLLIGNSTFCDICCFTGLALTLIAAFINGSSRSYTCEGYTTAVIGTLISKFSLAYELAYDGTRRPDHHDHMNSCCIVGGVICVLSWIIHCAELDGNPHKKDTCSKPVAVTSTVTTSITAVLKLIVIFFESLL